MKIRWPNRFLSVLLSAMLVANMFPTISYATETNQATINNESISNNQNSDNIINGTCGENLVWELNEITGILTISGTGEMYDYKYYNSYGGYTNAPWWGGPLTYWNTTIKKVVISDGVTTIGDYAFYRCKNLTDVELGNDIKIIGKTAFYDCDNLKEIKLPDELTTIEDGAFGSCDGIESIFIPQNVSSIADGELGIRFGSNIKSITVSNENDYYSSIDGMLFNNDATELLRCPEGKEGTVNIPFGTTYISENAFWGCQAISSINIPATLEQIEGMGDSYSHMFVASCYELSCINVDAENETFFSIDGVLFNKIEQSIVAYPTGKKDIQIYSVPNNIITKIESHAFYSDTLLGIVIPSTITCIEEDAFSGCAYLTDIYFGADQETWDNIFEGKTDEIEEVTIHYNSSGPDDPGIDQPETSMGSVNFLSKWDSNTKQAYFDYSALAYSVTDNTEIPPNQPIDQLVGKYVLVKMNESSPLEISSIKPVDSKIGTVTNVIEGNGNPSVTY